MFKVTPQVQKSQTWKWLRSMNASCFFFFFFCYGLWFNVIFTHHHVPVAYAVGVPTDLHKVLHQDGYLTCVISNRGTWGGIIILRKMEKEWKKHNSIIWDTTFNSSIDYYLCFKTRIQSIIKLPTKTTVFLVSVTFPSVWYCRGHLMTWSRSKWWHYKVKVDFAHTLVHLHVFNIIYSGAPIIDLLIQWNLWYKALQYWRKGFIQGVIFSFI